MPSDKPRIVTYSDTETIIKMKIIAKNNKRSVAKEVDYLITKHIAEYEAEHGRIEINDQIGGVNP